MSRDGSTLLVSDWNGGSHAIHVFRVADGSRLRVIGGAGDGPLQFKDPCQVWVASDDFVLVAEFGNNRVQVLTPRLDFHAFVGVGQLNTPAGVCADDAVIMVSERNAYRISMFNRCGGGLLRRFGSLGRGDGQLMSPLGLCFMSGHRHVAVADSSNDRVSVFSVEGEFVRHVGVGKLEYPVCQPHSPVAAAEAAAPPPPAGAPLGLPPRGLPPGARPLGTPPSAPPTSAPPRGPPPPPRSSATCVACSAFDELVVADERNKRVVVFGASGELLKTMAGGNFTGVALHGGTIFAQDYDNKKCILFTSPSPLLPPKGVLVSD